MSVFGLNHLNSMDCPWWACGLFNGTPIFLGAHSMLITLFNKHALFLSLVLTIVLILMVFGLRSEFN